MPNKADAGFFNPINQALIDHESDKALRLCTIALRRTPKDFWFRHWYYAARGFAYMQKGHLGLAVRNSTQAVTLSPTCPETLSSHTRILLEYGLKFNHPRSFSDAIKWGEKIIMRDPLEIMNDPCRPKSLRIANEMINDTRYIVAFSYWNLGNLKKARKLFSEHISHRESGLKSGYSLPEARTQLRELDTEIRGR